VHGGRLQTYPDPGAGPQAELIDCGRRHGRDQLAPGIELRRRPSEYFSENVYTTFQDDRIAFRMADEMNRRRLMWANDFPHSDSTWPWSQEMLAEHAAGLSDHERRRILRDNVKELYRLDVA